MSKATDGPEIEDLEIEDLEIEDLEIEDLEIEDLEIDGGKRMTFGTGSLQFTGVKKNCQPTKIASPQKSLGICDEGSMLAACFTKYAPRKREPDSAT
jgi:hypothetical protein